MPVHWPQPWTQVFSMHVSPPQHACVPSPQGPPAALQAGCPLTHWVWLVEPLHSQLLDITLGMQAEVE